ncbi:hypothetical protein C0J52_03517 [Blattella germanica]|nr:hypothetical protein C0J52_03517 [Blattella germanica]
MEKRRRARINQSLAVLKTLILDSARLEQNTKHSKLEKADILELTVRHLQRQRALGSAVLNKYRAGFQECTREVSRFLESSDLALTPGAPTPALDPTIKQRLLRHLDTCVAELDLDFGLAGSPESNKESGASPVKAEADSEARPDSSTTTGGDENNNSHNHGVASRPSSSLGGKMTPQSSGTVGHVSGSPSPEPDPEMDTVTTVATTSSSNSSMLSVVQVIPSRLPDGQVVFLLPSHYVQLAAAAAASEVGNPGTTATLWATTNGSNLLTANNETEGDHALSRPAKICIQNNAFVGGNQGIVSIDESIDTDSLSDQPIDFTVAKRRSDMEYMDEEHELEGSVEERGILDEVKEEGPVWRPW